jgi:hypothetical protein
MGLGVTIWTPPGGSRGSIAVVLVLVLVLLFLVEDVRKEPDPLALAPVVAAALPPVVAAAESEFEGAAEEPELWAALLEFAAVFEAEEGFVLALVAKVNKRPVQWMEHTNWVRPAVSGSKHLYSPAKAAMAMLLPEL